MRASLFVLIVAAAAGCYRPGIQPCELACSANGECPDGLTCNGQNACAMTSSALCNELPIDAPMSDTASSTVTIEVRDDRGGPLAAALVVFADSAGAQIAEMQTGTDGTAIADVPPGGSATVIRMVPRNGTAGGTDLHASTYLDLWPGAHIISVAEVDQGTRAVTFQLSPPTSTNTFHVYTSCTGITMSMTPVVTVQVPVRCPMFDAFVIASNPSNPMVNFAAVVPAQTGPSVAVPFGLFKTWSTLSGGALTGLPGNASDRTLNLTQWATPELPAPNRPLAFVTVPASGGFGGLMFPGEAGIQTQLVVTYQPGGSATKVGQVVADRFPAGTTVITRDYNGTLFPWLGKPTFDVGSRRMSWPFFMPTNTTPASPSFFAANVTYNHDPNMGVIWRLIGDASRITASGTQQSITYPDVPGMRTFEPTAADFAGSATITLFGVDPAAERAVRQILESEGTDLNYFKVPTLRHLTISIGQ